MKAVRDDNIFLWPLAVIASTRGFASQSHMTDVFRQKLGVTPDRYQREVPG